MGYSPLELDPVVVPLVEGSTVLDLGCGFGHWGQLLRTHYHSEDAALRARVTGVDISSRSAGRRGRTTPSWPPTRQ